MDSQERTPRRWRPHSLRVVIVVGLALLVGKLGESLSPTSPAERATRHSPPTPNPSARHQTTARADTPSSNLESQFKMMSAAAIDHQQALVRCRSPMLTQSGEIGIVIARGHHTHWEMPVCDNCPIYEQTALLLVPVVATDGYLRVSGGGEYTISWPPLQAGVSVDCSSIERIGRSLRVSGTVRFPSGATAPNAFVRGCRSYTWTDVSGRFEMEVWVREDGEGCKIGASYQHGESGVHGELVELSTNSEHQGLVLTVPEYPQWTAPSGASDAEACLLAASLREYWRDESKRRPLPEVIAEAKLALSKMPPPCAEGDTGE